jgi:hypothetical protein
MQSVIFQPYKAYKKHISEKIKSLCVSYMPYTVEYRITIQCLL